MGYKFFLLLAYLLMALSKLTYACVVPRNTQIADVSELVKRSKNIYFGLAVGKSNDEVYEFEVLENLRMTPKSIGFLDKIKNIFDFSESGRSTKVRYENIFVKGAYRNYKSGNYNNHEDKEFWRSTSGRIDIDPDCVLRPTFQVGTKYLLFVDEPYHFKSFEEISSTKDKWYQQVNQIIEQESEPKSANGFSK